MKTTITILAIIFSTIFISATAQAASYSSLKDGDWNNLCTWNPESPMGSGNCPGSVPGAGDSVQITHTVSGTGSCQSLMLIGTIKNGGVSVSGFAQINGGTVDTTADLTVGGETTVQGGGLGGSLTTKGITVNGAFTGSGSIFVIGGASNTTVGFVNNASVSVGNVTFGTSGQAFNYFIGGTGSWNLGGTFTVKASNTLEMTGTVPMSANNLLIPQGSKLIVNELVFGGGSINNSGTIIIGGSLTFNGTSFNNDGTLDIGSSTLNFNGTVAFGNDGTIAGTGTVRFAPSDGMAEFAHQGTNFAPGVTVVSGTIDYRSTGAINGPLVIDAGATLGLTFSSLTVNNDVTVNGTLTTLGTIGSNFTFNGSSFINNGAVAKGAQNSGFVFTFNNSGAARSQTLTGTGSWTLNRLAIGGGSSSPTTLTLQNDVTFAANELQSNTSSILNLNNHTLTYSGANFQIAGTPGISATPVTGAGQIRMQPSSGTATITAFNANPKLATALKIVSGIVTANTNTTGFTVNGLTVDAGATFSLSGSVGIVVGGDVTINGTLNRPAGGSSVPLYFQGGTFANNGTVTGSSLFINFSENFDTGAPIAQNLAGIGSWTGTGGLVIRSQSTTTLQNNVTYDGGTLNVVGRINTGAFTLSLPCSVAWVGSGDVVGNIRRTNLAACSAPIAFGNPFTTIQFTSGEAPTEITVNVALAPPPDFPNAVRRTYLIAPTGGSGYAATLRLHYLDSELNGNNESTMQLWRKDGTLWNAQGTTDRNTTDNWVEFAGVAQFSPWTLSDFSPLSPTAASVSVGGRVFYGKGRGISNARVILTDSNGEPRYVMTNAFGYYRFTEVAAGKTYILNVYSKRYIFEPQVVSVTEDLTELNFRAEP